MGNASKKKKSTKTTMGKKTAASPSPKGINLAFQNCNNYSERITMILAIIILAVFPLLMDKTGYTEITRAKFRIFAVITVAYVICCAALLIANHSQNGKLERQLGFGKLNVSLPQIFAILYLMWGCVSAVASEMEMKDALIGLSRYEGLLSMFLYVALFLCVSFWGKYDGIIIKSMSIVSIILGFIGICQLFGASWIYPFGGSFYFSHFLITIGNVDCVSGIVTIFIPILVCYYILSEGIFKYVSLIGAAMLLYIQVVLDVDGGKLGLLAALILVFPFVFNTKEGITKTLKALSAMVCVLAFAKVFVFCANESETGYRLIFNATRSGIILLIITIALFACAMLLAKSNMQIGLSAKSITKIIFAIIGVCIVLALIAVFLYKGDNLLLSEASRMLHGQLSDEMGSYRGYIWKNTVSVIKEKPLFGYGPGSFVFAFWPYQEGWGNIVPGQIVDFAHNDLLQIATCEGIPALVLYCGFVGSIAVRIIKYANKYPMLTLLGAGIVGYLVYSFFTFSIAIITPLFWVLAGIADNTVRHIKEENVEKQPSEDK